MGRNLRVATVLVIAPTFSFSLAQDLSEEDAILKARSYSRLLNHDPSGRASAKLSSFPHLGGGDETFWDVSFDDASVMLDSQGLLRKFGWGGKHDPSKLPPGNPFTEDGAASARTCRSLEGSQPGWPRCFTS
jgi:hypothetical protein